MKILYTVITMDNHVHLEGRYFRLVKRKAGTNKCPTFFINDIVKLHRFNKHGYAILTTPDGREDYVFSDEFYELIPLPFYRWVLNIIKEWREKV